MKIKFMAAIAVALFAFVSTAAEARTHHHYRTHHYAGRSGSCDGIHRCICGSTQARHFGLPRIYNGHNLWEAREWAHAFPHTSCSSGAVVVWPHHVARIVSCEGRGVITDETGTYTPRRDIHSAVFVAVNGGGSTQEASASPHRHSRRHHERVQFADNGPTDDWHGAH